LKAIAFRGASHSVVGQQGHRYTKEPLTMNPLKMIAFGLGLALTSTAIVNAKTHTTITANAVVCMTKSGIEAIRADMNAMQLQRLGCTNVSTDLRIDVLPPSVSCDPFLFAAIILPDKILRRWIRRDELDGRTLTLAGVDMDCRD
jgi:hypothetical protein